MQECSFTFLDNTLSHFLSVTVTAALCRSSKALFSFYCTALEYGTWIDILLVHKVLISIEADTQKLLLPWYHD